MKFTISSASLLNRLQAISRVINSKNTIAILDNFLFNLEDGTLTLTASDTETTMVTSTAVDSCEGNGKVAITAKLLLDTLREFSDQPITFEVNDTNRAIVIKSAYGSYNLIGADGNEYPSLPELAADARSFTINSAYLSAAINKTLFCTADDDLRPVMNGIFFDLKPEQMTVVATDAHKLVRYINTAVHIDEAANFILPKKPANMLKNVLTKDDGEVVVRFDNKNACFTLENYTIVCRQVEGRFPNYSAVIPQNNPRKIIVDRMSILNVSKRVAVFASSGNNLIKLAFTQNQISISAQDIDFSTSAIETIPCQFEDEPINIGFKSTFLIEILNNITSADVTFELADPSRAGLVLPFENEENEDLLMLLMPMLLNE